ncbi:MAG: hypothetical protein KG029_04740 [Bacteroidetes bacterium]|nr:hypothetical protein [Bacteroidota bacterium]
MDPITKRRYNLTYRARKKGIQVDGYRRKIILAFEDITKLVSIPEALSLIKEYKFEIKQDRQLKIQFK